MWLQPKTDIMRCSNHAHGGTLQL